MLGLGSIVVCCYEKLLLFCNFPYELLVWTLLSTTYVRVVVFVFASFGYLCAWGMWWRFIVWGSGSIKSSVLVEIDIIVFISIPL